MGVVYRATDLSLDRPVALKLIAPELAQDEHFRRRFLKEPRLAASLDHPNVIPIYEAGERDGQLYLAMRYVQGSDLGSLLQRERTLAPERALRILAQVAGALDAAHRRGLVHRDVKPANVLLDEDEHAYLTDFGITKQAGGASTDTGQAVGTLDYLAPEQIRGEPVDGRSDGYALACVLYECLAGAPPFSRETQAETLWAHLQEPPPPLPGAPALDPVLRRALAKEKDERYATGAELVGAARVGARARRAAPARGPSAKAGAAPPPRAARRRRGRAGGHGRRRGVVLLPTGGEASRPRARRQRGRGRRRRGERSVASFIESATAPSNIAVGEGAVWVLNTEDGTVARIDPETKAVTGRFETRGVPTDIAAGEGAVWIGNGGPGTQGQLHRRASRGSTRRPSGITRTVKLPNRTAGSVFVADAQLGLSRHRRRGRRRLGAQPGPHALAHRPRDRPAGGDDRRRRRQARRRPRGHVVHQRPRRDADRSPHQPGRRDDPDRHGGHGRDRGRRRVGLGDRRAAGRGLADRARAGARGEVDRRRGRGHLRRVRRGGGLGGELRRRDRLADRPEDERRDGRSRSAPRRRSRPAPARRGSARPAATAAGELPDSVCGELASGVRAAGRPDRRRTFRCRAPAGRGRARWRTRSASCCGVTAHRAGEHTVGYRSCDDSTAQTGDFEHRRCAANANAYARAERLVAVIGPYNSNCAGVEIPILNRAPGGPLAMISPSNTWPGLTRGGPGLKAGGYRGEPDVYYPTGARNYFRLRPRDDLQGAALAVLAKRARAPRRLRARRRRRLLEGPGLRTLPQRGREAGRPGRRLGDASTRRRRATRRSRTGSRARARRASCSAATRSTAAIGS